MEENIDYNFPYNMETFGAVIMIADLSPSDRSKYACALHASKMVKSGMKEVWAPVAQHIG